MAAGTLWELAGEGASDADAYRLQWQPADESVLLARPDMLGVATRAFATDKPMLILVGEAVGRPLPDGFPAQGCKAAHLSQATTG